MRIGEVIGTVTLNQSHPDLTGARYKLVVPLSLDDLTGLGDVTGQGDLTKKGGKSANAIVVYDELGAGIGSLIAISEGAEAAAPFYPQTRAIDAYNAAILDQITLKQ